MDDFLSFLASISDGELRRAPFTRRAKYPAAHSPYKPILLLSVLRRIELCSRLSVGNRFTYDECKRDFEKLYQALYGPRPAETIAPMVVQAYWYLGSGKPRVWKLCPRSGAEPQLESAIATRKQVKTEGQLRALVEAARFPDPIWTVLKHSAAVRAALLLLIDEYFPDVRRELERL